LLQVSWELPTPATFLKKGRSKTFGLGEIGKGGVDQKLLRRGAAARAERVKSFRKRKARQVPCGI